MTKLFKSDTEADNVVYSNEFKFKFKINSTKNLRYTHPKISLPVLMKRLWLQHYCLNHTKNATTVPSTLDLHSIAF